jgi:photosystem II stability/assembly factor-like uncharacterized protein
VATARTRRAARRGRPAHRPQPTPPARRGWWLLAIVAGVLAAAIGGWLALRADDNAATPTEPVARLPDTPDYHSVFVAPKTNSEEILLGTHAGVFRSSDGGRTWQQAGLAGDDAMNLSQSGQQGTLWAAGHDVLARSSDGGATWNDARPEGLPGLDVHGFAVDPTDPTRIYAAIAGQGLYRSTDGGDIFKLASRQVGPAVMGLSVTPRGDVYAADMQNGLVVSTNGGLRWRQALAAQVIGVAVNPSRPSTVLATGIDGILRSTDGGTRWQVAQRIEGGAGPVAWSPDEHDRAYVVGFDRTLYTTLDGGSTWSPVGVG